MRVVAGKYRGIVLNEIKSDNIRPTTDKVKEAIFSKIQFDIKDASFLDLFAGTGGMGIEALSRGAKEVYFADNNENSIKLIKSNFAKIKLLNYNLFHLNFIKTLEFLKSKNLKFDFIFLDPPYHENFGEKSIRRINEYDLLNEDGIIIYEHLREKEFTIPEDYEIFDLKHYGTISVSFIRKISNIENGEEENA